MKKLFAITMLVALLFYQGGYTLLFQYFIHYNDSVIANHISNNQYKASDLVEIKIPVKLPAVTNWDEYEPITGQVQLSGNCYNYVKLKITRDTMFLMVIPNHEKTRLVNANIIVAKQISDVPLNKKSNIPPTKRSFVDNDYNFISEQNKLNIPAALIKLTGSFAFLRVTDPPIDVSGQPPETIAALS